MASVSWIRFRIAVVALVFASFFPLIAGAVEVGLTWTRFYDALGDAGDLYLEGGGLNPVTPYLTSGTDVGSSTHHVDYPVLGYADFDGLVGGTVSLGYISGNVSAYAASNVSGASTYTYFYSHFRDSITIVPANPALLGTAGTLTGSVLVEVVPGVTALGTAGVVNDEAAAQVDWILAVQGVNAANAYFQATDEGGEYSYFCCVGPSGVSPAPTTVLVPVTIGFTFGVPFDFGFELNASAMALASTFGGVAEASADATMSFLNSAAWQGITSVRDGFDDPVESWIAESESGTDYTVPANPVPEPGGLWPLASGLVGLVAGYPRSRRRRREDRRRARTAGSTPSAISCDGPDLHAIARTPIVVRTPNAGSGTDWLDPATMSVTGWPSPSVKRFAAGRRVLM
jgi:hypothetical protein